MKTAAELQEDNALMLRALKRIASACENHEHDKRGSGYRLAEVEFAVRSIGPLIGSGAYPRDLDIPSFPPRRLLDGAMGLLDWAASDFAKHGVSNDNWYGEYESFRDHDMERLRKLERAQARKETET